MAVGIKLVLNLCDLGPDFHDVNSKRLGRWCTHFLNFLVSLFREDNIFLYHNFRSNRQKANKSPILPGLFHIRKQN